MALSNQTEEEPVLKMEGIHKSFGSVHVLEGVDLTLNRGEILGLIGENGAGKSTLIKILCGIHKMDQGQILLNGKKADIQNASQAQKLGISTIYQELSLMPDLNAIQNIFLNRELSTTQSLISHLDYRQMKELASSILKEKLNVEIDVEKPLRYLTLAQKQMVEIARTVYADAQIIIMDEPTAALEAAERNQLFGVIRKLKAKGHSIIFISHHLDELMEICDTVHILRDGKKVSEGRIGDFSVEKIITDMVGKNVKNQYPKIKVQLGETLMEVKNLGHEPLFEQVSFKLHKGEILGIVGLEGCGKNQVIQAIFGISPYRSGEVTIHGRMMKSGNIRTAMEHGIAFVPGERKIAGLFLKQDIGWNITVASLLKIERYKTILKKAEKQSADAYISQMHIKSKGHHQNVSALSGGNQQKVMLARWMMTQADVFLLEEPTRGIDVNAKTEVYQTMGEWVKDGRGLIVVSSEEEEVIGICDRILVMKHGKVNAVLNAAETTAAEIKHYSV